MTHIVNNTLNNTTRIVELFIECTCAMEPEFMTDWLYLDGAFAVWRKMNNHGEYVGLFQKDPDLFRKTLVALGFNVVDDIVYGIALDL